MNLSMPFRDQVRGLPIPTASPVRGDLTTRARVSGGGWIAETFDGLRIAIGAAWHREHNADNTHKTIHATGPVYERARTVPIGEWIHQSYTSASFTASGGASWPVTADQLKVFEYMFAGNTMWVSFYIETSPIILAAPQALLLTMPVQSSAAHQQFGTFSYDDNGTRGTGCLTVIPGAGGTVINLLKDLRGATTWGISANVTVAGQFAFEVLETTE